jgi:hypothetical protein
MQINFSFSDDDRKLMNDFIEAVDKFKGIMADGTITKVAAKPKQQKRENVKAPPASKAADTKKAADESKAEDGVKLTYDDVRSALNLIVKEHTTSAIGEILKRYPEVKTLNELKQEKWHDCILFSKITAIVLRYVKVKGFSATIKKHIAKQAATSLTTLSYESLPVILDTLEKFDAKMKMKKAA